MAIGQLPTAFFFLPTAFFFLPTADGRSTSPFRSGC